MRTFIKDTNGNLIETTTYQGQTAATETQSLSEVIEQWRSKQEQITIESLSKYLSEQLELRYDEFIPTWMFEILLRKFSEGDR